MATDHTAFNPRSRASSHTSKKRPSRAFWIKKLAEFSKSELSAQAFCRLKNLSASNFSTWRKRLREEEASAPPEPATFIPLEVMAADNHPDPTKQSVQNQQASFPPDVERKGSNSGLSLHVSNDLKISIDKEFHEPTLQRLVQLFSSKESAPC